MNPISPRRLVNEQISVLPLIPNPSPAMQGARSARYNFNRSPSKVGPNQEYGRVPIETFQDLRNINAMVRGEPMHGGGVGQQMVLGVHGY